eukprot:GHVN01013508.1.p1 GENE.GHVN01013508.1~~GHVN01013508.1.p1  ORF type:complete len:591 (-),score=81.69 GHVN01013508.1:2710-4482(-)
MTGAKSSPSPSSYMKRPSDTALFNTLLNSKRPKSKPNAPDGSQRSLSSTSDHTPDDYFGDHGEAPPAPSEESSLEQCGSSHLKPSSVNPSNMAGSIDGASTQSQSPSTPSTAPESAAQCWEGKAVLQRGEVVIAPVLRDDRHHQEQTSSPHEFQKDKQRISTGFEGFKVPPIQMSLNDMLQYLDEYQSQCEPVKDLNMKDFTLDRYPAFFPSAQWLPEGLRDTTEVDNSIPPPQPVDIPECPINSHSMRLLNITHDMSNCDSPTAPDGTKLKAVPQKIFAPSRAYICLQYGIVNEDGKVMGCDRKAFTTRRRGARKAILMVVEAYWFMKRTGLIFPGGTSGSCHPTSMTPQITFEPYTELGAVPIALRKPSNSPGFKCERTSPGSGRQQSETTQNPRVNAACGPQRHPQATASEKPQHPHLSEPQAQNPMTQFALREGTTHLRTCRQESRETSRQSVRTPRSPGSPSNKSPSPRQYYGQLVQDPQNSSLEMQPRQEDTSRGRKDNGSSVESQVLSGNEQNKITAINGPHFNILPILTTALSWINVDIKHLIPILRRTVTSNHLAWRCGSPHHIAHPLVMQVVAASLDQRD